MEYKILKELTSGKLEELVNQYLSKGWKLQGGVSIAENTNIQRGNMEELEQKIFCQAITIEK